MLTELQMTSPGLLRTFGISDKQGQRGKNLKIDSVRLGEINMHFKRQRDEGVSEGVGKRTPKCLLVKLLAYSLLEDHVIIFINI